MSGLVESLPRCLYLRNLPREAYASELTRPASKVPLPCAKIGGASPDPSVDLKHRIHGAQGVR